MQVFVILSLERLTKAYFIGGMHMKKTGFILVMLILVMGVIVIGVTYKSSQVEKKNVQNNKEEINYSYTQQIASTTKGFYFGYNFDQIMFMDRKSKKVIPLCSKPECNHENYKTCNSFISNMKSGIQYYEGKLYYISKNEEHQLALFRVDEAGNNKEEVTTLVQSFQGEGESVAFRIINNHIYIEFFKDVPGDEGYMQTTLYQKKLTSKEDLIKVYDAKNPGEKVNLPQVYKNKVYFNTSFYQSVEDELMIYGELYAYDTNNNTLELLLEDIDGDVIIKGDSLFYSNHRGQLGKVNLDTLEQEIVVTMKEEDKFFDFYVDDQYIYVDNCPITMSTYVGGATVRKIMIFDYMGNLVDTIYPVGGFMVNFVGNDEYLIFDEGSSVVFFDKSQIGKQDKRWERYELLAID